MKKRLLRELRKLCVTISPKWANRIMYRALMKKPLNLKQPTTFNEKINWLKLNVFPNDPLVIQCSDKVAVRDYLKSKGYSVLLNECYGVWDSTEEIDWDDLPNQLVLKCNHGCGYNIISSDKALLNKEDVFRQLNKWQKEDFWKTTCEPHYKSIPPQILCERFLGDCITDYKFFCFSGEPLYFYISKTPYGNFHAGKFAMFEADGSYAPFQRVDHKTFSKKPEISHRLPEMLKICRDLAKDFSFVRVDLFLVDEEIYFSELTFTPCAGMMPLSPESADEQLGNLLDIERYKR